MSVSDPPHPHSGFPVESTRFALVPEWVADSASPSALALYVHLACKYANQERICWPAQAVLARDLQVTDRSVKRAIRELQDAGAIMIRRSRRRDGKLGRNAYWLPKDQGTQMSPGNQAPDLQEQKESAGRNHPSQMSPRPGDTDVPSGNQIHEGNQIERGAADADAPDGTLFPVPAAVKKTPRRKPELPLPDDWKPNDGHRAYAREQGLDFDLQELSFRAHAAANDRRQRDWNGAFATWLIKSVQFRGNGKSARSQRDEHGRHLPNTHHGYYVES